MTCSIVKADDDDPANGRPASPEMAVTAVGGAAMSVKRSLSGHAGQCPATCLFDGLSDIKIGGRNDGQKGGQWH